MLQIPWVGFSSSTCQQFFFDVWVVLVKVVENPEGYDTFLMNSSTSLLLCTNFSHIEDYSDNVFIIASFGNEPMQSCSVRCVVLSLLALSSASSVYSSPSDSFDYRNFISCKYM